MVQFERVHQPSLVERVASDLREAIVSGQLRPGDKISDARVAADMGVSRAPVREAIRRLAAQGLVREEPRRGAFVASLSRTSIAEIYDCRRALEGIAARRVAEDSEAAVRELRAVIVEMRKISRRSNQDEMAGIDQHFHSRLCDLAQNASLSRLYAQISDQMRLILTVNNVAHPVTDVDELAAIHIPIVDALATGDPALAERAVIEHLDEAEQLFFAETSRLIDLEGA
jgi:GntR family transcriptional regulator of gluconate operon